MDFSLPANAPLLLAFAKLPDPRKERNRRYPLIDIIAVVLMGIICGANDVMSAYLWAQHRKDWFVSMGLCLNGLPYADIIRSHWGVENNVHWHLDVTFGEDQSKIRAGHGAENISLMRKSALNLLKADTSLKAGIENKRKMAGWNPDYLLKILGVK